MAKFSQGKGVYMWLKKQGFYSNSAGQIMKAYKVITKNRLKMFISYGNHPDNNNSFELFSSWFLKMKMKHPEIFEYFKKHNGQIELLKEKRIEFQNIYICHDSNCL